MLATDVKTVVGLFDDINHARTAVMELNQAGFVREDVNLVAHASAEEYSRYFDPQGRYQTTTTTTVVEEEDIAGAAGGASIGAGLGALAGLVVGLSFLTLGGGPILVSGALATTLLGAGVGGVVGSLIGSLTDAGVPEEHANLYAEGVRRGGTLVLVRTAPATVSQATAILNRNHPVDVEQRAGFWREQGFQQFNASAAPYTTQQIVDERRTYANSVPTATAIRTY